MPLALDHVIVCVADLAQASREFEDRYGVVSVEGGRHRGHGTANRLIPLGDNYVELLAVVAPKEAKTSALGTWALHQAAVPGGDAVCLRTDDLDGVCARLGLTPDPMSRVTPDGMILDWRLAGMKQAFANRLPFFIQWDVPDDLHPGRIAVEHPAGQVRLVETTISGNPAHVGRLQDWAPDPEGVDYVEGEPGVSYLLVASP
ncbi:MAG: VOC family protein [Acidimicrobiia bacterium]|jgi:hypothetical protein